MTDLEAVMYHMNWVGRYEADRDDCERKLVWPSLSAEMRRFYSEHAKRMQQEADKNRRLAEEAAARVRAVLMAAADREAAT